MIAFPSGVRVWLAVGRTDMRRYAEPRIMRSPRRGREHRRGFASGITQHNIRTCASASAWR